MRKLNSSAKFVTLVIATIVICAVWVTSVNAQVQLTERSKLALNGIGPIRIGMTVNEASQSAGVKLVFVGSGPDAYSCSYFKPQGELKEVSFMVTKGRMARIDISDRRIATIRGAKIGDTEDRIISLYPEQIQITKHPFPLRPNENRKHLTFVPKDAADKNYRIIFETANNRVYHLRSGKLPEVGYIEGCL
jgi:hypothetical protein